MHSSTLQVATAGNKCVTKLSCNIFDISRIDSYLSCKTIGGRVGLNSRGLYLSKDPFRPFPLSMRYTCIYDLCHRARCPDLGFAVKICFCFPQSATLKKTKGRLEQVFTYSIVNHNVRLQPPIPVQLSG